MLKVIMRMSFTFMFESLKSEITNVWAVTWSQLSTTGWEILNKSISLLFLGYQTFGGEHLVISQLQWIFLEVSTIVVSPFALFWLSVIGSIKVARCLLSTSWNSLKQKKHNDWVLYQIWVVESKKHCTKSQFHRGRHLTDCGQRK